VLGNRITDPVVDDVRLDGLSPHRPVRLALGSGWTLLGPTG
jgi:hypothetical protein